MTQKSTAAATVVQSATAVHRGGNFNNSARISPINLHVKNSRGGFRPSLAQRPVRFQGGEVFHEVA